MPPLIDSLPIATSPDGDLLPVQELAGPRFGHVHRSTLCRWICTGLRAGDGSLIRLRAWQRGGRGRWLTTRQALEEFAARVLLSNEAGPAPRTINARQRASQAAEQQLRERFKMV